MRDKNPQSLKIPLDDVVVRLESEIRGMQGGFIYVVKGKIEFPSGEVAEMRVRYDLGKNWIIDPLLQDHVLKRHVDVDEDMYLHLDDSGRSLDPNYQKWRDYQTAVSRKVAELLRNGTIKLMDG